MVGSLDVVLDKVRERVNMKYANTLYFSVVSGFIIVKGLYLTIYLSPPGALILYDFLIKDLALMILGFIAVSLRFSEAYEELK